MLKSFRGRNWDYTDKSTPGTGKLEPIGISINDAIEIFASEYSELGWAKRTLKFHLENLNVLKKYLIFHQGIEDIGLISFQVLKDFRGYLINKGLKKNTINGRIRTLKVFFRKMQEIGHLPCNLSKGIEEIKKRESPEIVPFSDEQIRLLLGQPNRITFAGFRDWVIMQVLLDTGIRLEELCNLKVSSVDLKHNSIIVVRGKGSKTRIVVFGVTTKKALMKYMTKVGLKNPEEYLFLNQDGGQLKNRTVQENIANYGYKAGLKGVRCSPHTFRHTFAKNFLMSDGDPYVLRDLLGHSTMNTVTIYLRLFNPDLQKKYRGKSPVDKLFGG
jgi:integrase/recombinase XerD